MILEVGWGSTLSRMSSILNYFNWLHLVFIFKNSKVFCWRVALPRASGSPKTHTRMSATTTVAEVLQSWRSHKGFASLLGGHWAHSLVHAGHAVYPWATHLHIPFCSLGSSDPPVPASWVSGTLGVCCHTPNQVFFTTAIYEVEFSHNLGLS